MPVHFKDYYATLGVARDASGDQIKKAFRDLARKHHPDKAPDKAAGEEKFKEINEAYEVLGDPVKRRKYDQLGARWQEGGGDSPPEWRAPGAPGGGQAYEFHFGGTGFSDFFERFFGGGGRHGFGGAPEGFEFRPEASRTMRGADIEGDILVTLEEAMRGTVRPVTLQTVNPRTGETGTRSFQVRIPPGATDGRRIRVPGHGEPGPNGGVAGDLFLRVRHAAHPDFKASGADLHHDLAVAPWEAVLGASIVVPTLDGPIRLRIPAGTANGRQLRVRGRGLPMDRGGGRGDFFVTIVVRLPETLTDEERAAWEKLAGASRFDPRSSP